MHTADQEVESAGVTDVDRFLNFVASERTGWADWWVHSHASYRGISVKCRICARTGNDFIIGNFLNNVESNAAIDRHRTFHDQELRGHPWDAIRAALAAGEPEIAKEIYDDATLR